MDLVSWKLHLFCSADVTLPSANTRPQPPCREMTIQGHTWRDTFTGWQGQHGGDTGRQIQTCFARVTLGISLCFYTQLMTVKSSVEDLCVKTVRGEFNPYGNHWQIPLPRLSLHDSGLRSWQQYELTLCCSAAVNGWNNKRLLEWIKFIFILAWLRLLKIRKGKEPRIGVFVFELAPNSSVHWGCVFFLHDNMLYLYLINNM